MIVELNINRSKRSWVIDMANNTERYMKRLMGTPDAIRIHRRAQNDFNNNYSFRVADGFRESQVLSRKHYDSNIGEWEDFEILLKHTQKADTKKIITRTGIDLPIGSYVKYGDNIVVISAQIMEDEDILPSYSAYKCLQNLYIKGCPYVFPMATPNSSYSTKGVKDTGVVELLDARNKAYVQRNKFTVRFFQNHKNYRIAIGDEEVQSYYIVTECDDSSTPGMFTLTLKADEKHPNDNGLYAYNENTIDFSDLIPTQGGSEEEDSVGIVSPELTCEAYQKLNKQFEVLCNKKMAFYELPQGVEYVSLSEDGHTLILNPIEKGVKNIAILDIDNKTATKKIVVKE